LLDTSARLQPLSVDALDDVALLQAALVRGAPRHDHRHVHLAPVRALQHAADAGAVVLHLVQHQRGRHGDGPAGRERGQGHAARHALGAIPEPGHCPASA